MSKAKNGFLDWCKSKNLGIDLSGADFDKLNLPNHVAPLYIFKSNPTKAKLNNYKFKQKFY